MAYPGDKTNYPAGLKMINRPYEKSWPFPGFLANLPSVIAAGQDRQFLPQLMAEGPLRSRIKEVLSARGFSALTVKNIPVTMGGPREWYPGAMLETLPSAVADIAGASGPRRSMHGEYTHRNYNLNPECSVEI